MNCNTLIHKHTHFLKRKEGRETFYLFFTRLESTVALLRWVLAQDERTLGMAVLVCLHCHPFLVVSLTFIYQLRQAAPAAKIDAELIQKPTVKEVVLL